MALTKASFSMITGAPVNVKDLGAVGDGVTDDLAAIQAAHDSLPASGGTIYFPRGNYCLTQDNNYINITKSNVAFIGDAGAIISSPNSANPEIKTGTRYLNGITVTGNNVVVSVNMRGPSIIWNPTNPTDMFTVRDMKMYNLYVGGIYISGTAAFDKLIVENVVFQDSRDLTSDSGNYEMIQRSSASTDPIGEMVVVSNCLFRSVSGGVDVHNVKNVMVCNGTRFEGVDINCVKLATSNNGLVLQNLTVDETVVFDGTAINPASANRHIACSTPLVRTVTGYTAYLGFIQVFNNVQFHGKAYNFNNNYGLNFLDGSYIDAVLNFDRSVWDSCFNAIVNIQGTVSMCDMQLTNGANIFSTSISTVRSLTFKRNRMVNSWAAFTKRCVAAQNKYDVQNNVIDYNVDNNGAIRFVNYGTDTGPTIFVDNNVINITGGGNTLAITDQGTGTRALLGANNVLASGNTFTAQPLTTYEQATAAYTGGLSLPLRNNEISVVNTNATGTIVYVINDATSPSLPIGTVLNACRTSAAQSLAFSCASGISGFSSATLASQFASITLKKVAANSWVITSAIGTVTLV